MKTALIVEDQPHILHFLHGVASKAFEGLQVHTAATCQAALALVQTQLFDLALIDLGLPDGSGIDVLHALRAQGSQCLAIVVTIYDDDQHLFPALQAGAYGYLLKEQGEALLVGQLLRIAQGEPPLSPPIARRVLAHFAQLSKTLPEATTVAAQGLDVGETAALTNRETEVLQRVAKGYSMPEIAVQFELSRHTVSGHIKQIYRKLDVSSRAEATLMAVRRGLVSP